MPNAKIDGNHIKAKLGIWCVDGKTPIPITINPANGGMMIDTTSVISYTPVNIAERDGNFDPVWLGTSTTNPNMVLPINVNINGAVLVAL